MHTLTQDETEIGKYLQIPSVRNTLAPPGIEPGTFALCPTTLPTWLSKHEQNKRTDRRER